jgi:hypothetical protein
MCIVFEAHCRKGYAAKFVKFNGIILKVMIIWSYGDFSS